MSDKPLHATAAVALATALTLGLGGLLVTPLPASAQTADATPAAHTPMARALLLAPDQRAEVEDALRTMSPEVLLLTFARIHAAFRDQIGQDDLRLARALVDYALLTEAEMQTRGLDTPEDTDTAAAMLQLYELLL